MSDFFKSAGKSVQSVGYAGATVGSGSLTVALAVTTAALTCTGILVPFALLTGAATYGCGQGTRFFAYKTQHKLHRALGDSEHEDKSSKVHFNPMRCHW